MGGTSVRYVLVHSYVSGAVVGGVIMTASPKNPVARLLATMPHMWF